MFENISELKKSIDVKVKGEFNLNKFFGKRKYMNLTLLIEEDNCIERQDFTAVMKEDPQKAPIKYYPIVVTETPNEIIVTYPEKNNGLVLYFEYRRHKVSSTKIMRVGAVRSIKT